MKFAAKKKKEKKAKAEGAAVGRKPMFEGLKLFKVEPSDKLHKVRETSRRGETFKSIRDGMKFETFVENGGNTSDLNILVKNGNVEARAE